MLDLKNLDERTRQLMLSEVDFDAEHNQLFISPVLSNQGQRDYLALLRTAIESGNAESLSESLRLRRRLQRTTPRRKPSGGYTIGSTPVTAADTLAEGEFNRYYIRALCRRAIQDQIPFVIVYRAKPVVNPRPQSAEALETTLDPKELLEDLRAHTGEATSLGVPGGPNSGLSVHLP